MTGWCSISTDQRAGDPRARRLPTAPSLLVDCATLYARTNDQGKRLANQALTDGIEISEDERATIRLAEPLAALTPEPPMSGVLVRLQLWS
ncbi:hypothetical protein BN11_270007 [Nostocoides australiense Ben110]|uniref:Uncharacterized protein n=1 Tax=Nostocoides australiense Ben110 TaxID=1193182 RepID=W6JXP7_9MICO|nr:hypothetical protein BN11_270007 [Tetrasphaera australiensis Ben110]